VSLISAGVIAPPASIASPARTTERSTISTTRNTIAQPEPCDISVPLSGSIQIFISRPRCQPSAAPSSRATTIHAQSRPCGGYWAKFSAAMPRNIAGTIHSVAGLSGRLVAMRRIRQARASTTTPAMAMITKTLGCPDCMTNSPCAREMPL
jgi:hypothetical protein